MWNFLSGGLLWVLIDKSQAHLKFDADIVFDATGVSKSGCCQRTVQTALPS